MFSLFVYHTFDRTHDKKMHVKYLQNAVQATLFFKGCHAHPVSCFSVYFLAHVNFLITSLLYIVLFYISGHFLTYTSATPFLKELQ